MSRLIVNGRHGKNKQTIEGETIMDQFKISAKALGRYAMPDFCPRCEWIRLKTKKLPYQIFPGIFSTIDSYTKKIVHNWIDRDKDKPQFLKDLDITGYLKVPHWSKFQMNTEYGITLSGAPDDLLVSPRGIHIPDYKTAKFTETQDKLFPMYRAQVNGYAKIAKATGINVDSLSLIYMEPATDEPQVTINGRHEDLFKMTFLPHFLPVELNIASIDPLLERAREIYDATVIPDSASGCKDCEALGSIVDLLAKTPPL